MTLGSAGWPDDTYGAQGKPVQGDLAMICILLSIVGIWIASLAIQQGSINEFYGADRDL